MASGIERPLSATTDVRSDEAAAADAVVPSRSRIVSRPNPNFAVTWVLAATVPLFWVAAHAVPLIPLALLFGGAGFLLARLDADRCRRVLGRRFADPRLALPTPLLYLAVRLLRDEDFRAGRPLWSSIALLPVVLFFSAMANIGAYAMWVHGW